MLGLRAEEQIRDGCFRSTRGTKGGVGVLRGRHMLIGTLKLKCLRPARRGSRQSRRQGARNQVAIDFGRHQVHPILFGFVLADGWL